MRCDSVLWCLQIIITGNSLHQMAFFIDLDEAECKCDSVELLLLFVLLDHPEW